MYVNLDLTEPAMNDDVILEMIISDVREQLGLDSISEEMREKCENEASEIVDEMWNAYGHRVGEFVQRLEDDSRS